MICTISVSLHAVDHLFPRKVLCSGRGGGGGRPPHRPQAASSWAGRCALETERPVTTIATITHSPTLTILVLVLLAVPVSLCAVFPLVLVFGGGGFLCRHNSLKQGDWAADEERVLVEKHVEMGPKVRCETRQLWLMSVMIAGKNKLLDLLMLSGVRM